MRNRNRFLRLRFRRSRLIAAGLSVVLLLSLSLGACGSSATKSSSASRSASAFSVVPVTGTVAGHGYGYWLQRVVQTGYSSAAQASPCETVTSNGQRVGLLAGNDNSGVGYFTCSEPAGRPLYVIDIAAWCSTFPGEHSGSGTSDQQLTRCAQRGFKGFKSLKMSATVDGKPVDVWKLLAASGVYPVQAAPGNPHEVPAGSGRFAAYGSGLLLAGLAKGTHVILIVFAFGTGPSHSSEYDTYTVHVR